MRFTHLKLENWRNFLSVDVPLEQRAFLVGPNASGKSNLLDAFRFLRDIAEPQGGLQRAVKLRGSVSQVRSLHARRYPNLAIEVEVGDGDSERWTYRLELTQSNQRVPMVAREIIRHGNTVVHERPDAEDEADASRQTQTHLEQVNANKKFRELADFFAAVRYLHLVPQLVREPDRSKGLSHDPFGGDFLEQLARTPKKTLDSRLRRIQEALRVAVPQLKELKLDRDDVGVPHLRGLYEHWRPKAGWQTEDQFSDGTLRLLGLLWVFLDGTAPLLLEEPELSLHASVVRHIPQIIHRLGRKGGRQVLLSTHSADLLSDEGIALEEVLVLQPSHEGTSVTLAAADQQIRALLEGNMSVAEAVLPRTAPKRGSSTGAVRGMKASPIVVTVALEGPTDVPIVERLLKDTGLEIGKVYVQRGKDKLDRQLTGYNNAARFAHWLVVRDLDQDAPCAPELKRQLLPAPSALMCLRVAVRAAESWLLADPARFAAFLGVPAARVPGHPDQVPDPKGTIVNLARHSRKRDVREDMVPRPGSSARVGPGYTSRIMEFAGGDWRPRTAVGNSPSLAGCLAALKRWKRRA